MIVKNFAAFRNKRLFPVVFRDNRIDAILKIRLDPLSRMRVFHQLKAHNLGADFLCDIVLCSSKAAGQDDDIRPLQSRVNIFRQPFPVVSHRYLMVHGEAE